MTDGPTSSMTKTPPVRPMMPTGIADRDGVSSYVRVNLRPIASPLPLGFAALAVGAMLTAALQLHWLAASQQHGVAATLLWFVAPLQLLACLIGFAARDVATATGMGVLAGSWAVLGFSGLTSSQPTSQAVGVTLLCSAALLLIPATTALQGKLVPGLVLGTAAVRFGCAGMYELYPGSGWRVAAGVVGLVLALLAFYAALALSWEDAGRSTALPLGRRPNGAIDSGLERRIAGLEREAGVRPQL